MDFLEWPTIRGTTCAIHMAWFLIWVAVIAGFLFLLFSHLLRYFANQESLRHISPAVAARIPSISRHSLTGRLFHWIMAASCSPTI